MKSCIANNEPFCAAKQDWIIKSLNEGSTKLEIAKKIKVSKGTLYRYLVYSGLYNPVRCNQKGWKENGIYH